MKKEKEKKKKRVKREPPQVLPPEKTDPEHTPEVEAPADPLQYMTATVGGKWKLRILWALRSGSSQRYGEIKQQISSITDMMLSQSLRELTASGLIVRQQYQQIPPKVEYQITPAGAELVPAMELLCAWAVKHTKEG